jgi:hypothetical protein
MDCKHFRRQHLAYLDDTLPGEVMSAAQHHVMVCNGCAAHDTLVRRSLMVARSLPTLAPSEEFQQKLRTRLAACRDERDAQRMAFAPLYGDDPMARVRPGAPRASRAFVAVATSAVLGILAYQAFRVDRAPELSMPPVVASRPAPIGPAPYINPQLVQVMSTGNPVWSATMMVEDAPMQALSAGFSLVSSTR